MKVLEHAPWSLEIRCTGCKSLLAAEKDDITAVEVDGDWSDKTFYHCKCPVCNTELDIEGELLSKVPSGIRTAAVEKYRASRRRGR